MDVSIIIPCFNEIDNVSKMQVELLPVLQEMAGDKTMEVVFVDDGSIDGTLNSLKEHWENIKIANLVAKFYRHEQNMGLGAAIRTGFKASEGKIVVTTDSDGTYKFNNIPLLFPLLEEGADIVTASPYHPNGAVDGVPGYRLILSRGSSLIYRVLVDWHVHTYTCLFRAYRREVIENISFDSDGFLAGTELMVKAMLKGYRVVEYPAVLYSRVYGTSKAKLIRTISAHLRFQGWTLLNRMHLISFEKKESIIGGSKWKHSIISSQKESQK